MDKQSNVLFNTSFQELHQRSENETWNNATRTMLTDITASIPVNTRTIGAPEGIYILYLEDYVHTFLKKIVSNKKKTEEDLRKNSEYQIEINALSNIALYGSILEEGGRYRIVISGAALLDSGKDKIQQLNNTYFPSRTYIGTASVSQNKDQGLRLELSLRSTKVILDDFYIYYDQNEEMQNYLVEWNNSRQSNINKIILSPTEQDTQIGKHRNDVAHLGRIAQSYNREEAKVSFMWNVMNLLCLGFIVCVMAYGIISINNYNKMQHMQASIDYCIAFITKNFSFQENATEADANKEQIIPTMQQNVSTAIISSERETIEPTEENVTDLQIEKEQAQTLTTEENILSAQESVAKQPAQEQSRQDTVAEQPTQDNAVEQPTQELMVEQPVQEQLIQDADTQQSAQESSSQDSIPQYYVVRKGDTLQTICYSVYGDYSRVDEICRWNNIENPDNILYGQKLLLP